MSVQRLQFSVNIDRPADEAFRWHEQPDALLRLTPPWECLEVVSPAKSVRDGERAVFRQKILGRSVEWEVEHFGYVEHREFRDRALRGPFKSWVHRHRVEPEGTRRCRWIDEIEFEIPGGAIGAALGGPAIRRRLERAFAFRQERLVEDLDLSARYGSVRSLRFLISGASGLVGRELIPFLRSQGHHIVRLVRHAARGDDEVFWDPDNGVLDPHALREIDAVIHLSGANVARRWTPRIREEIWNSRVKSTRTLVDALHRARHRPFVFVSASATGWYGSRGEEMLGESSPRGSGFLADVCDAWEREIEAVEELGIRPVMLRTGIVLSPRGGALGKLLPAFRAGVGGDLASGTQWMSWIAMDDLIGAYYHAVLDQRCIHEVNAVAPVPVTNHEFTRAVGEVLHRPIFFRVPAPALRLVFGDMANETLLTSARVLPRRLEDSDFVFRAPKLEEALRSMLGKTARNVESRSSAEIAPHTSGVEDE